MFIISLILFQVFVFIGLIYILRHILTKNVVSATRHLEDLNQDCDKKQKEINRQYGELKQKSEELLHKAYNEAEEKKTQIIKEAEEEKNKILNQARIKSGELIQRANRSRGLLISELNERISKEALNRACELIQVALPLEFKQDVHSRWIIDLIEDGFNKLEHLRVQEKIREVELTSAFPLDAEQRRKISKKLKELLKREVKLREKIDPKIVAGIIVTIGSLVLDGSLRNKIREETKNG